MGCGLRLQADLRPDARKPVTILFNDVTGSTSLGERFAPETVRRVMSRYFEVVSRACERHGGTVEKFIGDAVMAVFGIPRAQEDHALRAVRAAAELQEALASLNEELERDCEFRIETRTGLNSGECVAGDPAGGQALVTGDAVNVAARLEQAAAPGEILVGDATRELVEDAIEVEPIEPLALRGKGVPVAAWRLLRVLSTEGQLARRLDTPMLGRDTELGLLLEQFDRVRHDRTAWRTTVLGPAGIGKSRLAQELRAAVGEKANCFVGTCLPYGEGITFWPLAEIVRQATGDEPRAKITQLLDGSPHADVIADRVMQLAGLSEGDSDGRDFSWALRSFFQSLARERPLVVVFEDIHWAEPPLLDLIEHLTDKARDAPLMILCLAREDLLEKRQAWVSDEENAGLIALEPLSRDDTEELIEGLLPSDGVSEQVRRQLVERAEGNPLFVEQMLALLREDPGAGEHPVIPPTIQALLAARLDRLPVGELSVIAAASVVGKTFWEAAVSVLSRLDEVARVDVDAALAALERKELISPDSATLIDEDGFSFRHALIRDAAYEALTKDKRADLHERFAGWLEDAYQQRLVELEAILGYHLEQAYQYRAELAPIDEEARALAQRASSKLASAGKRAVSSREDATAVNLLSRATKLLPATTERLELLPLIGESLEGTANHAKAGEIYAEALEGAVAAGHAGVEGRARLGLAHVWFSTDPEKSLEEIVVQAERAIPILESTRDGHGLAQAWRLVGEARMYQGRAAEGERALEKALDHAGPDPATRGWNAISFAMGMCLLDGPTPLGRAVAFVDERLALARQRGLRSLEADMLHLLGTGEGRRGRFQEGRLALKTSTAISEELGLTYMAQWANRSLGNLELAAGDPEAAERALRSSYEFLIEMELKSILGDAAIPLADCLYRQGRYEEAESFLDVVKDDWASSDVSVEAQRLAVRAKLLAARGWDRHAERAADRALRLVRRTDWACLQADTLLAHAEVLELADRGEEAVSSWRSALEVAEAKGYSVAAVKSRSRLERLGKEVSERVL